MSELALGLEQPLFERADPLRGVLEPSSQDDDLLLERLGLGLELTDLALVLGEAPLVLRGHVPPPARASRHPSAFADLTSVPLPNRATFTNAG